MSKKVLIGSLATLAMAATAAPASAITWIDFTSITAGTGAGSSNQGADATGSAGGVTATVTNASSVYSVIDGTWNWNWPAYTGNTPTTGDMIAFSVGGAHTITLSPAVTTIYLAVLSWNDSGAGTTFSSPFTVVSQGDANFGGVSAIADGVTISCTGGCTNIVDENNGILAFAAGGGTLTFTDTGEAYHGLAIGFDSIAPVPEASTWAMMLAGFGMLGAAMRRRKTDQRVRFNFG